MLDNAWADTAALPTARPRCAGAALPHRRRTARLPHSRAGGSSPQFYQRLREGEVTEHYLWETRLLPLLGYLSADEATAVRCWVLPCGAPPTPCCRQPRICAACALQPSSLLTIGEQHLLD